ncbi:hypothetical protein F5141DRAFT_1205033 [Pisolithus sp. B1]|nr:hypothetical protein F5141DRAFT_1205556 [Pisolithus sp. B1]KAI6100315.1 hypothetical protein F5141DRAFT_1205033 [Pisolithus sp. B1]
MGSLVVTVQSSLSFTILLPQSNSSFHPVASLRYGRLEQRTEILLSDCDLESSHGNGVIFPPIETDGTRPDQLRDSDAVESLMEDKDSATGSTRQPALRIWDMIHVRRLPDLMARGDVSKANRTRDNTEKDFKAALLSPACKSLA